MLTRRRFLQSAAVAAAVTALPSAPVRAAETGGAIDIHAHLPLLKFGGPLATRFAQPGSDLSQAVRAGSFDVLARIRISEMDEWGVEKTTLMPIDFNYGREDDPHWAEAEAISEIARKHPDRFIPFFACDPRRPNALELLDRAVDELGMKGIKLHPLAGFAVDDADATYAFYERCAALRLPIVGHCRPVGMPNRDNLSRPERYARVAADFPALKLCMGHLGGEPWMRDAIDALEQHDNLYGDLSTNQPFAIEQPETVAAQLRRVMEGPARNRIMYASDWPTGRELDPAFLDWLRNGCPVEGGQTLNEEDVADVLRHNAAVFLQQDN